MSFDDSNEIKRLRRELDEVTAERDYLLRENRRLIQPPPVKQAQAKCICYTYPDRYSLLNACC